MRFSLIVLLLTVGCSQSDSPTTSGTLTPTCSPVGDGTLSIFNADGSFRTTTAGVLPNGKMAVNACDGDTARIMFVDGLRPGTARNHQEGVFTDSRNTVVYVEDLLTTSLEEITPKGLEGVKVQCSPIGGCGEATPAAEKPPEVPTPAAEPTAPAAATDPATSDASPVSTPVDPKVAAGS